MRHGVLNVQVLLGKRRDQIEGEISRSPGRVVSSTAE